ncbi:YdbC family protein [Neobacillus niacini]|uniref:YdbC family protein n=1 Tax=Neobacillus niacini TaxID=86668 RepID=UPI0021CB4781|nr:YdbC family protein [Neobacillus niacini]MCM3768136.1 YdbC family protein [Neobacillus niacini]
MADIKFEIIEKVAVLSESAKGWTKELNLISWNGREPKYDIRDWSPEYEKMGKGITLSNEEVKNLKNALDKLTDLGK